MAREASDWTKAIRELCDKSGGTVTHLEAREQLKKMGHTIAEQPERPSDEYNKWLEVAKKFEKPNFDDKAAVKAYYEGTFNKLGVSGAAAKTLHDECEVRRLYAKERSSFDMTKNLWAKNGGSSSKPASSKNKKAKFAAKVAKKGKVAKVTKVRPAVTTGPQSKYPVAKTGRRGRPRLAESSPVAVTVDSSVDAALARIEELGGMAEVAKKIAQMQHDLEVVAALEKRVKAVA